MMKSDEKYQVPAWMRPLTGTGDVDQATGIIAESGETGQLCGA